MNLIQALKNKQVIAYPTESVFGLGCDPDSELAVQSLLKIKQRPWQKGLILVAAHYSQIIKYINFDKLNNQQYFYLSKAWNTPITWIMPARSTTPEWLTGSFSSIAIRISSFEPIIRLCLAFNKPLISTSANLFGEPAVRTNIEVLQKLKIVIPTLNGMVGGHKQPSIIYDTIHKKFIR